MHISNIINVMAIVADILTIAAIWGLNAKSPLWIRIGLTVVAIVIGIVVTIMCINIKEIAKLKDYIFDEEEKRVTNVFIKKNKYYEVDTLVSIYKREEKLNNLVAVGLVVANSNSDMQIDILKVIDEKKLLSICKNIASVKKFNVRPNVRYTDLETLGFLNI